MKIQEISHIVALRGLTDERKIIAFSVSSKKNNQEWRALTRVSAWKNSYCYLKKGLLLGGGIRRFIQMQSFTAFPQKRCS